MAFSLILVNHFFICLVIGIAFRPAYIKKELCKVQIFFLACNAVQLSQPYFHYLVAGVFFYFAIPKILHQQVSIFQRNVQQVSFTGSVVMRIRSFVQVARIVQLMAKYLFIHPAFSAHPFVRNKRLNGPEGVQVTIRFLRCANYGYQRIKVHGKLRVGLHLQRVRCAFYPFVYICIIKRENRVQLVGFFTRRRQKIIYSAMLPAHLQYIRYGYICIYLHLGPPELIIYMHLCKRNRLNWIILFLREDRASCKNTQQQ